MAGKKAKRAGRPAKKATGLDRKISAKTAQSKKTTRHPSGAPKKNTQLRRTHSTVVAKRGATTKPTSKPDGKDASYGIRPSSKLGIIVTMLQQKDGSTIAEMARATGWQKHSDHVRHLWDLAHQDGPDGHDRTA